MENLKAFEVRPPCPTGVLEGKHLTFWIDKQLMGISIANVVQIVGIQAITSIPDFPIYCKGIISLRGNIIPLIDLRLRFGMKEEAYTERTCIIVCHINESDFGYIVDGVDEVANIPDELVSSPPQMMDDVKKRYLTGIARLGEGASERIILLIDAEKVLGEEVYHLLH